MMMRQTQTRKTQARSGRAWRLALRAAVATVALTVMTGHAIEVPEAYSRLWNAPEMVKKIDGNIEIHRKGDAEILLLGEDGKPLANASLEVRQASHEFLFGCNLFVLGQLATPELNRKYEQAFANLFNFATLPFYWRDLEPEKGKPRFAENAPYIWRRPPPDQLVKWCKTHGITPKGHVLMYAKNMFMPEWSNPNDPEALRAAGLKHMTEIAQRYGRDIPIWDAVNEEISRLASPGEWHKVPADYLHWCFKEAGRLFPGARLLINEGVVSPQYEEEVRALLNQGVPVEGIGIQSHLYNLGAILDGKGARPAPLYEGFESMGRLGLPLYITEITVPSTGQNGPDYQAVIVANLYRLWFSTPAMAGVTWWNLGDGTAFGTENRALGGLLDSQMNPKPAYKALDRLINQEWKTNARLETDARGRARFRGFYGKYQVKATVDGKTQQFELNHAKAGAKEHKLTFN